MRNDIRHGAELSSLLCGCRLRHDSDDSRAARVSVRLSAMTLAVLLCCSAWGQQLLAAQNDETVAESSQAVKLTLVQHFDKGRRETGATVYDMALSPDSSVAMLGSDPYDKRIFLWDIANWKPRRVIDSPNTTFGVALSPDGRHAATTDTLKKIFIWDLPQATVLHSIPTPSGLTTKLVFSPDGRHLAAAGGFVEIPIWDVESGREVQRLKGHEGRIGVWRAAFLPNHRLVSGGADGTLRIWNVETGQPIHVLQHPDWIWALAVSADGQRVLSGTGGAIIGLPNSFEFQQSPDNRLRVFDAKSGRLMQTLDGHEHMVMSVAFSPDGRWAASGGYDQTVRLWDLETGKELARAEGQSFVTTVFFLPDGRHILCSGGATKRAKKWVNAPDERLRLFRIDDDRQPSDAAVVE